MKSSKDLIIFSTTISNLMSLIKAKPKNSGFNHGDGLLYKRIRVIFKKNLTNHNETVDNLLKQIYFNKQVNTNHDDNRK